MVWISTGMPMRFSKLATLTYAGVGRNIYIDVAGRRLYLNVKYNKNHKFTNRILFMTDGVSRRLWWCICLLRTFTFVTFHNEIGLYDKEVFIDELKRELINDIAESGEFFQEEDTLDATVASTRELVKQAREDIDSFADDISAAIMKMFAFVDIKNHRLFDLKQFTNVLKSYPKNSEEKENHFISSWKQGLAALWKHFIIPHINMRVNQRISEGFGTSAETFRGFYGVDTRFIENSERTFEEMSAACMLFHEFIGAEKGPENKVKNIEI